MSQDRLVYKPAMDKTRRNQMHFASHEIWIVSGEPEGATIRNEACSQHREVLQREPRDQRWIFLGWEVQQINFVWGNSDHRFLGGVVLMVGRWWTLIFVSLLTVVMLSASMRVSKLSPIGTLKSIGFLPELSICAVFLRIPNFQTRPCIDKDGMRRVNE